MLRKIFHTAILITAIAPSASSQIASTYAPCQEMPLLIEHYNADEQVISRFYSPAVAGAGRGGGGQITTSGSPEKKQRLGSLYDSYLLKLDSVNFDQLSQECKVDYILLKRDLNEKKRLAAAELKSYNEVRSWFPFGERIYAMEALRRRGIRPDPQKMAAELSAIKEELAALTNTAKNRKDFSITAIRKVIETIGGLQASLKSTFDFYNGYDPMFTWWLPTAYLQLDKALTAYSDEWNKKQVSDKNGIFPRDPVGNDELISLLKYEMIPYTPEEITKIANEEFAWCEKEMIKVSKQMGFGENWKAAVEKVKNTYVAPGKQPEAILRLYNESVDFIRKNDLITIPPLAEEVWGMNMMSAERQRINAFFTGGADITISYPTDGMDEDFRLMSMRGNNPNFSRATVHHELLAGHNLQQFMNSRVRSYRRFGTPFWTEGWSLYWELILWDMNFAQTPEEKVGMLFWHMHRCARIIFSFQFHTGKWTPQQCIDFLVDKVGNERANAESEIRGPLSGNSNPLYQVAYLTGGRQFYALKKEFVDSKKMSYKSFHDQIMQLNAMPVEMIRAILMEQPLTKNFQTSWKFY